jgi:hypothetical protein
LLRYGRHRGIGQVDYCAANAFLDALAHEDDRRRRFPTVSIDWDAWRDARMAARNITKTAAC